MECYWKDFRNHFVLFPPSLFSSDWTHTQATSVTTKSLPSPYWSLKFFESIPRYAEAFSLSLLYNQPFLPPYKHALYLRYYDNKNLPLSPSPHSIHGLFLQKTPCMICLSLLSSMFFHPFFKPLQTLLFPCSCS